MRRFPLDDYLPRHERLPPLHDAQMMTHAAGIGYPTDISIGFNKFMLFHIVSFIISFLPHMQITQGWLIELATRCNLLSQKEAISMPFLYVIFAYSKMPFLVISKYA